MGQLKADQHEIRGDMIGRRESGEARSIADE